MKKLLLILLTLYSCAKEPPRKFYNIVDCNDLKVGVTVYKTMEDETWTVTAHYSDYTSREFLCKYKGGKFYDVNTGRCIGDCITYITK